MRIFVYEFVSGGGWFSQGGAAPPESLLQEGRAIVAALAADFSAIEDTQVDVLHDIRQPSLAIAGVTVHRVADSDEERQFVAELAAQADWTVLIAPEFDSQLLSRAEAIERCGGRLLGPSSQIVALASDKQATAEHLSQRGIAVPRGLALSASQALPTEFPYPAVIKPRDGCGSLGIRWVETACGRYADRDGLRLEGYCPGMPASVACLCGPDKIVPLVPCRQILAHDFSYLGGRLPLTPQLAARAQRLAVSSVANLPNPFGYIGVDLILGDNSSGRDDVVVEINPRVTTSYVGLRAFSRINLAAAMIRVAQGQTIELCWNLDGIQFTSSGDLATNSGKST